MVILSAGSRASAPSCSRRRGSTARMSCRSSGRSSSRCWLPTIAVVATTIIIYALKTFDVVYTMTNGNFDTDVIANRCTRSCSTTARPGRSAAVAVILFLAIVPVMIVNIQRFRAAGGGPMTRSRRPVESAHRSDVARSRVATRSGPSLGRDRGQPVAHRPHGDLGRSPRSPSSSHRSDRRRRRTPAAGGPRSRRRGSSRSTTTSTCSAAPGIDTGVRQQLRHHDPGDGARRDDRRVRRVRIRLDGLPRPEHPVRGRRRAARRSPAGHADPGADPVPRLHAGRDQDQRHDARGVARPHRLRPAIRDLPATELLRQSCPSEVFESAAIDGASPSAPRSSGWRCR